MTCRNTTGIPDPDLCSKYCIEHPFESVCVKCGLPLQVTYAGLEVLGSYHDGCFGYPACVCVTAHRGACPSVPPAAGSTDTGIPAVPSSRT